MSRAVAAPGGRGGAEPAAVLPGAGRRDERDRPAAGAELALPAQGPVVVPGPGQVGDVGGAVARAADPPAAGAVVGQRGEAGPAGAADLEPGPRLDHEVVAGVRGDQHADRPGAGAPLRARVVELHDLAVAQALPAGALGAVLRHAVAVAVAVPVDRDARLSRHGPAVLGRLRGGAHQRQRGGGDHRQERAAVSGRGRDKTHEKGSEVEGK